MNPQFVVLGAFSSQSSRTFFHVFPELSRSIVNAMPGEKDYRVARFPTGTSAPGNSRIKDKANRPFLERQLCRKLRPRSIPGCGLRVVAFLERHVETASPWTLG